MQVWISPCGISAIRTAFSPPRSCVSTAGNPSVADGEGLFGRNKLVVWSDPNCCVIPRGRNLLFHPQSGSGIPVLLGHPF